MEKNKDVNNSNNPKNVKITKKYLDSLVKDALFNAPGGTVADYIPELRRALRTKTGISLCYTDNTLLVAGDNNKGARGPKGEINDSKSEEDDLFTIQSISKVFALMYVLEKVGEEIVFGRVGMEPTGDPFNADPRIRDEGDVRMPYNPMINVGAIYISSLFPGDNPDEKFDGFFEFVKKICGDDNMIIDESVYKSEKKTGHNNRALAWKMMADRIFIAPGKGKVDPNSEHELEVRFIEDILDNYFRQCSILVHCDHLARAASILAFGGKDPSTGIQIVSKENTTSVISLMSTCGLYDGSGEFAYNIGIPGKSGVGGGIMCVVPGLMGIGTFSPALDKNGNSVRGLYMLNKLSRIAKLHIFSKEPHPHKLKKYGSDDVLNLLAIKTKFQDEDLRDWRPASYIPELGAANALDTGISICYSDGEVISGGDHTAKFTLQAISNLFGLLFVLDKKAEGTVFRYIGKEPSGEPFNVLKWKINDEKETKRMVPFNPMINAGAIAIASMIPKSYDPIPVDEESGMKSDKIDKKSGIKLDIEDFLTFIQRLCGNPSVDVNKEVFKSELRTGYNNRSLAWLMNDKNVFNEILASRRIAAIDSEVIENILGVYFQLCSIEFTCDDLARAAGVLANGGKDMITGENIIPQRHVTIATAMMSSSGLYDESGEFAYKVGIPSKSGVSGGIIGVVPGKMGIATYGPVVNGKGNSFRGMKMFEEISKTEGLSIFRGGR
jgi:glutaminase